MGVIARLHVGVWRHVLQDVASLHHLHQQDHEEDGHQGLEAVHGGGRPPRDRPGHPNMLAGHRPATVQK